MKFRTTLIAALFLALLGTYVYFFEHKKAKEQARQEEEEKQLFSIDWERVRGLVITNAHGTFRLEKGAEDASGEAEAAADRAAGWRIVEPLRTAAENAAVNGMVNSLRGVRLEQVVAESAEDLEPFGLKDPQIRIEVLAAEGERSPPPILLGGKSPIGHNSYAIREGEDKVLLLSTYLTDAFDKDLFDLRDKRLFAFKREDIERVRILRTGEPEVELVQERDRWELIRPIRARASETATDKIVNKLITLRAQSFDDEDPPDLADYGLDRPVWKIEVVLKPDQTLATLLIGSIHEMEGRGYLYAKRGERPAVVSLGLDLIEAFDQDAYALRAKRVLPFRTWEIKKAEMGWAGENVVLEKREHNKWWIAAPIEARADGVKVSGFLGALSRLEGDEFLDMPEGEEALAEYGLADPLARVVLYEESRLTGEEEGPAGEEPDVPLLGVFLLGKGKGDEKRYYAAVEGEDTVYRVPGSFYENDFPEGLDALRSKKALDVSRFLVNEIEADWPEGTMVLARKALDWKFKKPRSGDVERRDVDDLLSEVLDLEVDRFLQEIPEDLAVWGLDPPAARITFRKEDGEELGVLLFSDAGIEGEEGLVYVKSRGEPWVGLIQEEKKKAVLEILAGFRKQG